MIDIIDWNDLEKSEIKIFVRINQIVSIQTVFGCMKQILRLTQPKIWLVKINWFIAIIQSIIEISKKTNDFNWKSVKTTFIITLTINFRYTLSQPQKYLVNSIKF